jgi:hypothetical protein
MATKDIILHIFYLVAITLPVLPRHSPAKLYPSELVTIAMLFALKGGYLAGRKESGKQAVKTLRHVSSYTAHRTYGVCKNIMSGEWSRVTQNRKTNEKR